MRYFSPLIWLLLILACVEGLLEYRARGRGFETLFFGKPAENAGSKDVDLGQAFGPTEAFPFRSQVVPRQRKSNALRLWVASASHAHDSRVPATSIFPSQLGEKLASIGIKCEILNASHPGDSLLENELELRTRGPAWKPDVVLIYQMSTDLVGSTRNKPKQTAAPRGLGGRLVDTIHAFGERTTIYELLKSNVSSRITSASLLDRRLPDGAQERYFDSLNRLVDTSKALGAKPVVCTFCFSHEASQLPDDYKLVLLKTAPNLVPGAWPESIATWNQSLLTQNGFEVIDLAKGTSGHGEYFRDPVHFSLQGHEHIATRLAEYFASSIASSTAQGVRK